MNETNMLKGNGTDMNKLQQKSLQSQYKSGSEETATADLRTASALGVLSENFWQTVAASFTENSSE